MKTEIFTFDMPETLIADKPAFPRDSSKLLHIRPNGQLSQYHVSDLDKLLRPDDVLVFNDTKVRWTFTRVSRIRLFKNKLFIST